MKAVFLDRDGVINEYPGDRAYVTSWESFRFLPDVVPGLKKLTDSGFRLFIASNQAGVSKGIYTQAELDRITRNMLTELSAQGVRISGVYYCIHSEAQNCSCRKPKTGLIEQAAAELAKEGLQLERSRSFFVGDTIRDVSTGRTAGLRTVLVFSGREKASGRDTWEVFPDYTAQDLFWAADLIAGLI